MGVKSTLSENVYRQLKDHIIQGKYEPGSELTESTLAEDFNVSRTPIREALRRLEQDMIVRIIPHKGALVTKPTLKDIVEISNLREVLEGLAARMAVKWIKDEDIEQLTLLFPTVEEELKEEQYLMAYEAGQTLHEFILKKAKNERLVDILENLRSQVEIVIQMNTTIPGRYKEAYKEHMEIITAFRNRDENMAEQAMRKHIQNVLKSLMDYSRFSL